MKLDVSGEISFRTARSGGKGGQNVNKVESMVIGYFDIRHSAHFTDAQKDLLEQKLESKINSDGFLLVKSQTHRSQLENKQEVIEKMQAMLERALIRPKPRKATKPSFSSKLKKKKPNRIVHRSRTQEKKSTALIKGMLFIIWKMPSHILQRLKGFSYSLFLLFVLGSFQKKEMDSTLTIQFRAYVHGVPLELNKKYQNPFGETFEITRFRFYAGKLAPVYTDANFKSKIPSHYHLIDFSDSATTRIDTPVTAGIIYNGIQFQMGIDSADQNRGAQSGALDPAKGMFWTWNSGYINIKIEGNSPLSTQPAHIFEYHIGGYRNNYNTVWQIKLYSTNDQSFLISKKKKILIEIGMDLDYLFDGPTPIHIGEVPSCMKPGELARKISENFIGTFTGLTISPIP